MLVRVPPLRQPVSWRFEKRWPGAHDYRPTLGTCRGVEKNGNITPPLSSSSNNEIQFAGAFGEKGTVHTLAVAAGDAAARDRQLVKADTATARVPELDFEIPAGTQAGTITTVEGVLTEAATALRALQPERRAVDADAAAAIDAFCEKLDAAARGDTSFTLVLDDPAGNSGIESSGPGDPLLKVSYYERSREQAVAIGLLPPVEDGDTAAVPTPLPEGIAADDPHHGAAPVGAAAAHRAFARLEGEAADSAVSRYAAPEEVVELPGHCAACGATTTTRMYATRIPFFKDVILMADSCDACGYRNSEVKGGGGVPPKGRRIALAVTTPADLRRDVIKAETARLTIPELELEVTTGTLGGLITTVEGLVESVASALERTHGFALGDAASEGGAAAWKTFFAGLKACAALDKPWTLILTDPMANSFVSGVDGDADPASDSALVIEDYERSPEEDAEYGIDHLKAHEAGNAAGGEGGAIEEGEEEEG